eukprot:7391484-Prymnesium_polylepis.2
MMSYDVVTVQCFLDPHGVRMRLSIPRRFVVPDEYHVTVVACMGMLIVGYNLLHHLQIYQQTARGRN